MLFLSRDPVPLTLDLKLVNNITIEYLYSSTAQIMSETLLLTKWQDNKESFFPSPDKKKYSLKSQKMHPGFYYVSKTLKIKFDFTF